MIVPMQPSKYKTLVDLAKFFNVPRLTLIGPSELRHIFVNFDEIEQSIASILRRSASTQGNTLLTDVAEIEKYISQMRIDPNSHRMVRDMLEREFGDQAGDRQYAVRSAAISEDLGSQSFAGLYETQLDVSGTSALIDAIKIVWASSFSPAVLVERLRCGNLDLSMPMSVILQEMVRSAAAGIAFSVDPRGDNGTCVVEEVTGLGEAIVSGRDSGRQHIFPRDMSLSPTSSSYQQSAAQLCLAVEQRMMCPVDIEWAFVGDEIFLLQARPITTSIVRARRFEGPAFKLVALYESSDAEFAAFSDLPEFVTYFRKKRKRIVDFSYSHGLKYGVSIVVEANRRGFSVPTSKAEIQRLFKFGEAVIDLGGYVRQMIVPVDKLHDQLMELMPAAPDEIVIFTVREFIRGTHGLISEVDSTDRVLIEWSPDGLLAMNRGTTTSSQSIVVGTAFDLSEGDLPFTRQQTEMIVSATKAAQSFFGPVRIEWVADEVNIYAIDYSLVLPASTIQLAAGVISNGYGDGNTLIIGRNPDLETISIAASVSLSSIPSVDEMGEIFEGILTRITRSGAKPIIVVDKPYAALAAVLPHVAGFIFETASLLCHLSILIREHGLPAIAGSEVFASAQSSQRIVINTKAEQSASFL